MVLVKASLQCPCVSVSLVRADKLLENRMVWVSWGSHIDLLRVQLEVQAGSMIGLKHREIDVTSVGQCGCPKSHGYWGLDITHDPGYVGLHV